MADIDVLDTTEAGGRVIRGGVARAAGYLTTTALSVLSFALITRHLGVARFGDYTTALSIVTAVAAITDAGMQTLAVREYASLRGPEREETMRALLGLRLVLTAVGITIGVAVGAAAGLSGPLLIGTALAGVGAGLNLLQAMVGVPLQTQLRLGVLSVLEVVRQIVLVALLVTVVLAGGGAVALLAAMIPAGVVGVVGTVVVLRRGVPWPPAFVPAVWRRLAVLALPIALTTATGTLYVYLTQILTEAIADPTESGLFAASFRVFVVVGAIPGIVVSGAFPLLVRAARDDQERLAYAVDRLVRTVLVAGGLVALVASVGAPVAIEVIAGDEFAAADEVLRIQAWALLGAFLVAAGGFTLLSLRRHREIIVTNALGLVAAATATVLLVPEHGAQGAAVASVIGEGTLAVATFVALARVRPDLRPRAEMLAPFLAALAAGVVAGFATGLPALPAALLAAGIYSLGALVLRAVPPELLDAARSLRR